MVKTFLLQNNHTRVSRIPPWRKRHEIHPAFTRRPRRETSLARWHSEMSERTWAVQIRGTRLFQYANQNLQSMVLFTLGAEAHYSMCQTWS